MKLGRLRVFCTSCARRALRHPVGRLILLAWFLPAGILFGCSSPYNALLEAAFASSNGTQYAIVVDKKNYTVHVYNNARVLVASYPAGYGLNPDGGTKLHSGDNRTPEGLYHVNEILSMDASPDSPAYKKLRRMNDVFFTARDGHYKHGTNEDLGSNVYGPRFYGIDYPNENDKKRYEANIKSGAFEKLGIGGGIAVHGNNDQPSIGHKSSSGCVRMYNKDVVELERYILIGTPVIIL